MSLFLVAAPDTSLASIEEGGTSDLEIISERFLKQDAEKEIENHTQPESYDKFMVGSIPQSCLQIAKSCVDIKTTH